MPDAALCRLEDERALRERTGTAGAARPIDRDSVHTPWSESLAGRSWFARRLFWPGVEQASRERERRCGGRESTFFQQGRKEFNLAVGDGICPHEAVLVMLAKQHGRNRAISKTSVPKC